MDSGGGEGEKEFWPASLQNSSQTGKETRMEHKPIGRMKCICTSRLRPEPSEAGRNGLYYNVLTQEQMSIHSGVLGWVNHYELVLLPLKSEAKLQMTCAGAGLCKSIRAALTQMHTTSMGPRTCTLNQQES